MSIFGKNSENDFLWFISIFVIVVIFVAILVTFGDFSDFGRI